MTQDSSFKIPIAFLVFVGFAVGLLVSFWFAGMFGMTPPLFWPAVVIFFLVGVLFLAKPKAYVIFLFIYYGFFVGGMIFGHYYVRIPFVSILDELLLAVPLAIIVMKAVNRSLPRGATVFPILYFGLCFLSYKVNHVSSIAALRGSLSYFKFYIYWYFARCVGPWSEKQKKIAVGSFIGFALLQFVFNIIWQRGLTRRLADLGMGTIGGAHHVAYLSVFALLLLITWFLFRRRPLTLFQYGFMGLAILVLAYDSVVFTGAKHVIFLLPFIALPILFSPRFSGRLRITFILIMMLVGSTGFIYVKREVSGLGGLSRYWYAYLASGRHMLWRSIFTQIPEEVPMFYLFGAGPNNCCSSAAVYGMCPLGNKYVLPYVIRRIRGRGNTSESSVVGSVFSSAAVLWAEYGPPITFLYYGFWIWVALKMWRWSIRPQAPPFDAGVCLALSSSLLMIVMLSGLIESFTSPVLVVPVWFLIGIFWDFEQEREKETSPAVEVQRPSQFILP